MVARNRSAGRLRCFILFALLGSGVAGAHSASDAYLTLVKEPAARGASTVIHAQWDVALRDLDFVLRLDDDGDGRIVWRELRAHQAAIQHYLLDSIGVSAGSVECKLEPTRQLVDDHADGAYAALFFDIACPAAAGRLTLDYRLFFAIDPSHRGILVMRSGTSTATSVLSPQNARVEMFP